MAAMAWELQWVASGKRKPFFFFFFFLKIKKKTFFKNFFFFFFFFFFTEQNKDGFEKGYFWSALMPVDSRGLESVITVIGV